MSTLSPTARRRIDTARQLARLASPTLRAYATRLALAPVEATDWRDVPPPYGDPPPTRPGPTTRRPPDHLTGDCPP